MVVTDGQMKMKDGAPVTVLPSHPPPLRAAVRRPARQPGRCRARRQAGAIPGGDKKG